MAVKKPITPKVPLTKKKSLTRAKKASAKKLSVKVSEKRVKAKRVASKKIPVKKLKTSSKKTTDSKSRRAGTGNVILPTNMSQRTVEKSLVIGEEYKVHLQESMYRIATVAGLCFILIGTTLSAASFATTSSNVATIVSTTSETTGTVHEVIPSSEYDFLSNPPQQILKEIDVKFYVSHAEKVTPYLVKTGQTGFFDVETHSILDNKYKTTIDPHRYPEGYYTLRIFVAPENDDSSFSFSTEEFHIGQYTSENELALEELPAEEEKIDEKKDEELPIVQVENGSPTEIKTEFDKEKKLIFSLFSHSDIILSGYEKIGVNVSDNLQYVELHLRPVQSLDSRFVELAVKRSGKWVFEFDSNNIPNGKYEFFAVSKHDGEKIKTESLVLHVKNDTSTIGHSLNDILKVVPGSEVADTEHVKSPAQQDRPWLDASDANFEASILREDVSRETEKLIEYSSENINELLKRYAVAQQSGDEILIQSAREALGEEHQKIILEALQNESIRDISDDINDELLERFSNFENRIDTFEQIRKERSGGKTSTDTDEDGISDFDEINLYDTDPEVADTDNDGVSDGVEIVKGFNPLNEAPEAVIHFESPKDSIGLVRDNVMKIDDVIAVVPVVETGGVSALKTEVRGRALPNSFVTLYIFSAPTVVTIKTDSDGSFVYTFNKELEDGRHDVYVAITDNAGEIVAQSNPFSFIKTAEAFSPIDASDDEVVRSQTIIESSDGSYNTVTGIGILALGLILIMLGITLRSGKKDAPDETQSEDDLDDTDEAKFEH
ncbi:MAG: Ig-like domain-containing protein, partial [Candidatus Pacebacteria bacterium]|nr:Ig-like domain-containing protein [Candidatus Paceibacterota bacterium]